GESVEVGYEVYATQNIAEAIVNLNLGGLLNDINYVPNVVSYFASQLSD
ncbi:MAG: hypothetical protein UU72_C0035G0001, partial [candidate division WWE3 bacterium GW2011_GWB1_41_6]